jgi:hypothetical protein
MEQCSVMSCNVSLRWLTLKAGNNFGSHRDGSHHFLKIWASPFLTEATCWCLHGKQVWTSL